MTQKICGQNVPVILSRRSAAKDLEFRSLRSFAVSAAQDDGSGSLLVTLRVSRLNAED